MITLEDGAQAWRWSGLDLWEQGPLAVRIERAVMA